ncbi:hypothetical protein QBC35DRAFT_205261 [Podospora australis]|uniref:Uncharacterized protein n=1 Tax=Podospora australis TaxID=1536484 RepID=A0AAN6WUP5_9PEZI|nr:hypothetical protein QBC35DRAFT_205261 [Podospora australis]
MTSTSRSTTVTAFEPPESLEVVETPTSPSSGLALSRFEFETGKGNEGTKVLMVEWDVSIAQHQESREESGNAGDDNDWDLLWEGKTAALAVRDADSNSKTGTRRVYFLLPTGASVPTLVSIARKGGAGSTVLRTKPMPAIFPAELSNQQEAGLRGVLHSIWAKRRLAELQDEIEVEMRTNVESVGLEMAAQEREWIVDHFGLGPDHGVPKPARLHIPQMTTGPTSPRSPIGGKLGEKLRGLKLATSPAELAAATQATKDAQRRTQSLITTLSPVSSDPSVSIGRGAQAISGGGGIASLDAVIGTGLTPAVTIKQQTDDANEEDLFALPMSPRSPEMRRSPFSIL